jgi:hypothetical protein
MSIGLLDIYLEDQAVIDVPLPVYEQIRLTGRVVRNGLFGVTMVPNYADVPSSSTWTTAGRPDRSSKPLSVVSSHCLQGEENK